MRIALAEKPIVEPVLLAETKEHLRIDGVAEDAKLASFIASARAIVEVWTGLVLITRLADIYLDHWHDCLDQNPAPGPTISDGATAGFSIPENTVRLPLRPLQSITSISSLDDQSNEVVWDASSYYFQAGMSPAVSRRNQAAWPVPLRPVDGIKISVVAGFGDSWNDVPDDVVQALLNVTAFLYFNRGDEAMAVGHVLKSSGALAMLSPYRLVRV